jgi:hypothetical protein
MSVSAWLAAFGLVASSAQVFTFDREVIGKAPAGWSVAMTNRGAAPKWEVLRDQTARTQPYVLAQISRDPNRDRAPLAVLDTMSLRDGEVSVRLKFVAGKDQSGGVVWRYRDENNYYVAHANATSGAIAVDKVEKGRRIPIFAGVKHNVPSDAWMILKVWARGDRFQVYLDHRRIIQGEDRTFLSPGKVGLWTVADAVAYFDDFRVLAR